MALGRRTHACMHALTAAKVLAHADKHVDDGRVRESVGRERLEVRVCAPATAAAPSKAAREVRRCDACR